MSDVVTTIEDYLRSDAATAINGAVVSEGDDEQHTGGVWAKMWLTDGEQIITDAAQFMDCYLHPLFEVCGDTKDEIRVAISALRVLWEPLPTDWTGVQLIDIKPIRESQPMQVTNAGAPLAGEIEFELHYRVSYA